ncbi:MAG: hypothetical protein Q8O95_01340 [bacterium]|nr:hypothetical protein [bacterium]
MKKLLISLLAGLLIGFLSIGIARFVTATPTMATHFHANFSVFFNGVEVDLSDDRYMEDVQGCKPDYVPLLPEERTHMHNNEDHVIHVHDRGVTWGHFFANIGWAFGDTFLSTDDGQFLVNGGDRKMTFLLNGKKIVNPFNSLIESEDKLLINYGPESDEVLMERFKSVPSDAHEHNEHPDPGSCSGGLDEGILSKLRKAFWF